MKRLASIGLVVCLIGMLVVAAPAEAQNRSDLKVGYVDLNAVLQEFGPYQEAMDKLEKFRDDIQSEIDKNRKEINTLRKELRDGQFLSQEQQKQKQQQLQKQMQSFRQKQQRSERMMQRREKELLEPVRDSVQEAVKITAEELGYDVVHRYGGRQPSTVMWVSKDVDMTDAVIDRLNQVKPVEDGNSGGSE